MFPCRPERQGPAHRLSACLQRRRILVLPEPCAPAAAEAEAVRFDVPEHSVERPSLRSQRVSVPGALQGYGASPAEQASSGPAHRWASALPRAHWVRSPGGPVLLRSEFVDAREPCRRFAMAYRSWTHRGLPDSAGVHQCPNEARRPRPFRSSALPLPPSILLAKPCLRRRSARAYSAPS